MKGDVVIISNLLKFETGYVLGRDLISVFHKTEIKKKPKRFFEVRLADKRLRKTRHHVEHPRTEPVRFQCR